MAWVEFDRWLNQHLSISRDRNYRTINSEKLSIKIWVVLKGWEETNLSNISEHLY
jgi:hypothetical protein